MNLVLKRYSNDGRSTAGLLFEKQDDPDRLRFLSHTLEDEERAIKIKGETRIPAGFYELAIKREETPLTLKCRKAYGTWFTYFIELLKVPGFNHVYIHAGNTDEHTDGCILLGRTSSILPGIMQTLKESQLAVADFYSYAYPKLETGEKVFLVIEDED